jgi:GNAT superfamily N-acetyltransferase
MRTFRSVHAIYLGDRGDLLVGSVSGEIVAMGGLRRLSATAAEIKRMRVDVRFWRQGFGRALLGALEARARELGYWTVRLDTSITMVPARRLYEASGYREIARELHESDRELLIFEKRL